MTYRISFWSNIKRAEIQGREVNRELWRKKWVLRHCDLDLWPKVTNFKRIWASLVSNHLSEDCVKIGVAVWSAFYSQTNRQTDRHTHTQTDVHSEAKIFPSMTLWSCKKRMVTNYTSIQLMSFFYLEYTTYLLIWYLICLIDLIIIKFHVIYMFQD